MQRIDERSEEDSRELGNYWEDFGREMEAHLIIVRRLRFCRM